MFFEAIINYALDGVEPELNGIISGMFSLIKPNIDANNKKYENGKKGGRLDSAENYKFTKCKKLFNTKTMREISKKFYTLENLRNCLVKIEKINYPF